MKKLLIAANWKSHKTMAEVQEWCDLITWSEPMDIAVVVFAPFPLLTAMSGRAFAVGAQTVSTFPQGAFTGEVSADMLTGLASWVLIGHSERRTYFGETDEFLEKKTFLAKAAGLSVMYCVSDATMPVPTHVDAVAYEPIHAIGSGNAERPEEADLVVKMIKERSGVGTVVYGGSVNEQNVMSFLAMEHIDGVLVGGASLDPVQFSRLVEAASLTCKQS